MSRANLILSLVLPAALFALLLMPLPGSADDAARQFVWNCTGGDPAAARQ